MRTLFVCQAFLLLVICAAAQTEHQLNVMPMPSSVQFGTGQLRIDQSFSIATTGAHDASLARGEQRFIAQLSQLTGIRFRPHAGDAPATLQVRAEHGREELQKLGEDESYQLTVSEAGAQLTAATPLGVLHGWQTFLQLVEATPNGFAVPAVTIKDRPRFAWRGMLIDVSRHFIPLDVLKRNLDGMAAVKMNVLHFHLSDDQGFRVESKRFPKLHTDGSDGQYYTQAELRDFLEYAYDRGIRVVPEFDMPGHSRSWLVAYPELASVPGPYKIEPDPNAGPDAVIDPTQDGTYKFLDKFVEEMGKLFPDAYFHIGGDEVSGKPWDSNPKIQEFIHAHNMKSNQDLQAYFNQRLQKILEKHHKIMVGWDEVLHPDLPKTVVVQSWRGQQSLAVAARQGYSGLLSFGYYLDLMWSAARHYAVDPMSDEAANLSAEEKARILGGEACMWAEFVTPENLDSRLWPRGAAIAERLWSPQDMKDAGSMYARLGELSWRLTALGLTHESGKVQMLQRMANADDISALRTLADVVEPVKDYTRMDSAKGPWDFRAPLNGMVDAARPESDAARNFQEAVQAYLQSGYKDRTAEDQIRGRLLAWRDNDRKLRPLLQQSFLLRDVAPLSENLSGLGDAGLYALDYLSRSESSPAAWRAQQVELIEKAKAPTANLLLMVVGPVQQLVEASGR